MDVTVDKSAYAPGIHFSSHVVGSNHGRRSSAEGRYRKHLFLLVVVTTPMQMANLFE